MIKQMTRRNLKFGVASIFLVGAVFFLAGCGKKEVQQNDQGSGVMEQNQEQGQPVQRGDGERADRGNGNLPIGVTNACDGKVAGDSCEVTMPARNGESEAKKLSGVCTQIQDSETIVCKSNDMPKRPERGGPQPQTGAMVAE